MIEFDTGMWDAFLIVVVPLVFLAALAFWLIEKDNNGG
jgi:hypothetical protein